MSERNIFSIESMIEVLLKTYYEALKGHKPTIKEDSLMAKHINSCFPDGSITNSLEKILKPNFANSVCTWHQIEKALTERYDNQLNQQEEKKCG